MNFTVDRNHGEQIRVTLFLDEDEARKLANLVRELTGDARPPTAPKPWKRMEAPQASAPKPPKGIRSQIQAKLRTPTPRSAT